jgi:hypothetical protein
MLSFSSLRIWFCCCVEIVEQVSVMMQDPDVINARLPVFHRPPSAERDATIMRPAANDNSCLQVQQTTEYLVPLLGPGARELPSSPSTSSVAKLLPGNSMSDQETGSVLPESKSTQPLLEEASSNSSGSTGKLTAEGTWSPVFLETFMMDCTCIYTGETWNSCRVLFGILLENGYLLY